MNKIIAFISAFFLCGVACAGESGTKLPREISVNGVEFVLIPEGWFYYISKGAELNKGKFKTLAEREFKVWTDAFYIGKYEARARDFARFMNTANPSHAADYFPKSISGTDTSGANAGCGVRVNQQGEFYELVPNADLPATHLSWDLAVEFAQWMGFRLPTDAEWVHAFRGEDRRIFPWGDDYPDDTYASFAEGATACNTAPVTSRPKGRSPYGAYNMAGNVFEYVADWSNHLYEGTLNEGVRNPLAVEPYASPDHDFEKRAKLRGGRWASGPSEMSIYGNRDTQPHNNPFICYGTRFAISTNAVAEHLRLGTATILEQ